MKVGITIDDKLLKRLDRYADENYMSRSGLISLSVNQFLNTAEITSAIKEMALCMRKIAECGTVDHETLEKLEDLERIASLFSGEI